jgi:hypothetical protein
MSEMDTGQPEAERQFSLAERARRGTAIALAGILPIAFPVLHEEEVVWEETVTKEVVITGTTDIVTFTQSDTEIQDQSGGEIADDKLIDYLTFRLTETDETDEFADAVARIVKPDSKVLVSREGDDIVIRTDDFAEHPELEPKDNQAQTVEIAVNGKLVHGERLSSQRIQNPDEIILVETTEERRVPVPVIFYPLAVIPEKPEIVDEGEGEEGTDPIEPANQENESETSITPEQDELATPEDLEATPEQVPSNEPNKPETTQPEEPEPKDEQDGNETEPPESGNSEKSRSGGDEGAGNTQGDTTGPTAKEIYDEYIRQTTTPRGVSIPNSRAGYGGNNGREQWSLDFSARFPRLRGFLIPLISVSVIIGAAYAWREAEFELVEDCELGTPEQPLNIEKQSGQWLPEFSRPDCPEPEGHEVTISFDGFERGYGLGALSESGEIDEILTVPQSAMPDKALDHFAGDQFTSQVRSLLDRVDQAREQIANQTGQDHNSFDTQS